MTESKPERSLPGPLAAKRPSETFFRSEAPGVRWPSHVERDFLDRQKWAANGSMVRWNVSMLCENLLHRSRLKNTLNRHTLTLIHETGLSTTAFQNRFPANMVVFSFMPFPATGHLI